MFKNIFKKCSNVACNSFIHPQYKGIRQGYCSDWCKEMISSQKLTYASRERKRLQLLKSNLETNNN